MTILYGIAALLLALYTLGHGVLLVQYRRHRHYIPSLPQVNHWPRVMVQLPLYNERYVALHLINAVAALDYPPDQLHIQILDDSDDSTSQLIAQHLQRYSHLKIEHLRRKKRMGYKAGALAYGLQERDSPFVAIFDADFLPPPDFLKRTVPYLVKDKNLAVVQTRWGHLNPEANWLTRAQVLSIDNHFLIEQTGRNRSNWFVPFNGTGGIWRVEAIQDAGGWSDSTLTEDLDLSFRAQLKNWHSLYLPELVVDGELPPQIAAFRQQQARWAKGGSQCFRKLIVPLWQSDFSLMTKLMATHHLAQYVPHLLMLIMLLLAPLMILTGQLRSLPLAPLGIIGLIPLMMYAISQYDLGGNWSKRLLAFPILLLVGTGMIWSNALAVIRGFVGEKGEFHRTPKFVSEWQSSHYVLRNPAAIIMELLLMLYAAWGACLAWQSEPLLMPYMLIHALSFMTVALWDIRDQLGIIRQRSPHLLPESAND